MRFLSAVAVASLAVAGSVQAQGGGITTASTGCTGVAGDACQQAVDYFRYVAPMLGTAFTGGNTTPAQGGTLGGMRFGFMPRFAISVRGTGVLGFAPKFAPTAGLPASPTPTARKLSTTSFVAPGVSVDGAFGLFKGIPLGVTNVGGWICWSVPATCPS